MKRFFLLLITFTSPWTALAHGGDKPGPHGGFVTMPGPFHVELVMKNEKTLQVFLLDIHFKNPRTLQSSVEAMARHKKTEIPFQCRPLDNHFICESSQKIPSRAEIAIQATREKVVGNKAIYQLPLRHSSSAHH